MPSFKGRQRPQWLLTLLIPVLAIEPAKVCVTGASGYFASELVAQLLDSGYHVHGTVRNLSSSKVDFLRELPGSERLRLSEADLLAWGSFKKCAHGARFFFHTASPFVTVGLTNTTKELLEPAIIGTRNAMKAAQSAGVHRVVLTSSMAAIFGKPSDKVASYARMIPEGCFSEDDWNESSSLQGDALDQYRLSKVQAERAAWELVAKSAGTSSAPELVVLNPSFIIGPPRTPRSDGESLRNMKQLLEGGMPHRGDTPTIDVRDLALAHIRAATIPKAAGKRFITSTSTLVQRTHVVRTIREAFPHLKSQIVKLGDPDLPPYRTIFCSKTISLLGIAFREPEDSLVDMATAMLKLGSAVPQYATSEL